MGQEYHELSVPLRDRVRPQIGRNIYDVWAKSPPMAFFCITFARGRGWILKRKKTLGRS